MTVFASSENAFPFSLLLFLISCLKVENREYRKGTRTGPKRALLTFSHDLFRLMQKTMNTQKYCALAFVQKPSTS